MKISKALAAFVTSALLIPTSSFADRVFFGAGYLEQTTSGNYRIYCLSSPQTCGLRKDYPGGVHTWQFHGSRTVFEWHSTAVVAGEESPNLETEFEGGIYGPGLEMTLVEE
jgi:hypothetical protein